MRGDKAKTILLVGFLLIVILMISFTSAAGVGLKWSQESVLVPEKTKACMTYYIYNPWDTDTYAQVKLSDEVQSIVSSYESERKFIPAHTSSQQALPIEFCFKTPYIYERDCWIGDTLFCKQECNEEMKIYSGEVEAVELSEAEFKSSGSGGSATQMSVSAPIKVGIQCIPSDRDLSLIYIIVILIAGALLTRNIIKKRKNNKNRKTASIKSKKKK